VEGEPVKKRKPTHRDPTVWERLRLSRFVFPLSLIIGIPLLGGIAANYTAHHPMHNDKPQEETWLDAPYLVAQPNNPKATPLVVRYGGLCQAVLNHSEISDAPGWLLFPKTKARKCPKPIQCHDDHPITLSVPSGNQP
jgi:hypothetical protein